MHNCLVYDKHFTHFDNLRHHLIIHGRKSVYACNLCGKNFSNKIALRTHTGERPYACDICLKRFSHKVILEKHYLTHIKSYQYSFCFKEFSLEIALQNHLLLHADEKPDVCQLCRKCFPTMNEVKEHELIPKRKKVRSKKNSKGNFAKFNHLNKSSFKYTVCDEKFKHAMQLKTHFHAPHKIHASDSSFICEQCGKLFEEIREYEIHLKSHNDVTITFLCEFCKEGFLTLEELKKHESKHKASNEICTTDEIIINSIDDNHVESKKCTILCEKCGDIYNSQGHTCQLLLHETSNEHSKDSENIEDKNSENIEDKDSVTEDNHVEVDDFTASCLKCGCIFYNRHYYSYHLSLHAEDKDTILCEKCGDIFYSCQGHICQLLGTSNKHSKDSGNIEGKDCFIDYDHVEVDDFTASCLKCGYIFYSRHYYSYHLSLHAEDEDNSDSEDDCVKLCDECGDIFDTEGDFLDHMLLHK